MPEKFDHIFVATKDFDSAKHFYCEVLGWSIDSDWGDATAGRGCSIRSQGGMSIVLAEEHDVDDDNSWRKGFRPAQPTIHLVTDNVAARYEELKSKLKVVVPLEDTHWGVKWFVVVDPDGNLLAFTTESA